MNDAPARIAIVGSGALARAHARVAVAHPGLRLVAVVDPDKRSATLLAEDIVNRLEGERPALFPDLDSTLAAVDVDIVAVGDAGGLVDAAAIATGKPVIGGAVPSSGAEAWFAFAPGVGPLGVTDDDAAFASHLRQYERVLALIGFGPHAVQAGAGA
ncbi:MAG: Gfo/Idh/MocA family oxidoreductase [Leifsonia sp.]